MVDLWPHSHPHLEESNLLLNISHYTNCATGRSHASTVWPKKKSRLWLWIQILKPLLTIKLTWGSSRHIWQVRAFQLIFQDISHHVILESFQCIFLGIDSFLVRIWSSHPGVCNCFCLQIPGHPIAQLHQFSDDWWSTAKTSWLIPEDKFRKWFWNS
jgi:hypothetical protein